MSVKPKVLLVDDDSALLLGASIALRERYDVVTASSVASAKGVLVNSKIETVVVDLNFEGQDADGLDLIDWVLREQPILPIVVLSGDISTRRVIEATRRPLVNFIVKSSDYIDDLRAAINQGLEMNRVRRLSDGCFTFQTKSPAVRRVLEVADRVATSAVTSCNVLICGETGTGKEVLAKHFAARAGRKLVSTNMAGIPREMVESQLFGHVKGAFTGAHADQIGLIPQAHKGVFFLDELGECTLPTQTKLLRAIQEKEITPLGASRSVKIDVQFLSATNRDLDAMVETGDFRLDLLQRLNTVTLTIPPLRDRPEDVEFLAVQFLNELSPDKSFSISGSGIDALQSHQWPGNTRELENFIKKIVVLSDRRMLDADMVKHFLTNANAAESVAGGLAIRRETISALEKNGGNRSRAARDLGIHTTTLFRRLRQMGIGKTVSSKRGRPPNQVEGVV
jgi:DNA-binding NtrC family response regulator